MSSLDVRVRVLDALIAGLAALKYQDTTKDLFVSVKKIYLDYPESTPCAALNPTTGSVEVVGNTTDDRMLGFQLSVYEKIQNATTQAVLDAKIDRLCNVEDQVLDYLQKIPNSLQSISNSIHLIKDIIINQTVFDYVDDEKGVQLYLYINFSVVVTLNPRLL